MKAYPIEICGYVTECRVGAKPEPQDWNEERRKCFQEGYEAAEKDIIEMIWWRISEIVGDAQPKPTLRAELEELITKIKTR